MDVDAPALREAAHALRPRLLIVAGSMCLHAYDVAAVRAVADEVGAHVLYDAAHVGGLIAGGRFQDPLREGAHLITGSTYKSFGGPPAGMVLTDDAALAQRLDAIAFPGLTANDDLARTAALALAALDLLEHGPAYADAQIANARALAAALAAAGVPVFRAPGRDGSTDRQHLAVAGAGDHEAKLLEGADVLVSVIGLPGGTGLRLGTQELTRRGFEPADMPSVAALIARVLVAGERPADVRGDVIALRRRFGRALRFVRTSAGDC
jgi:glycine hydroxymethyltransferase